VGPFLNGLDKIDTLNTITSHVTSLPVSTHCAATMFFLNVQSWKHQSLIRENYSFALIDQLEKNLEELTKGSSDEIEIEWKLRQLAFEKLL
jgi:hypothetical protein